MERELLRCMNCGCAFMAPKYYHSHGQKHERKYCDQQCRVDAKIAETISIEEIARRARIIRELRESGELLDSRKLDWFRGD